MTSNCRPIINCRMHFNKLHDDYHLKSYLTCSDNTYRVWQRRFPLICRKAGLSALKRAITATLMLFGNSNQFQYVSSFNIYHKHWPSLSHALLFEENITCRNNSRRLFGCKFPVWPCIRMHLCKDHWDYYNLIEYSFLYYLV